MDRFNYTFFAIILALLTFGIIMIFSASPSVAINSGDSFYYIKRHLFYLIIGLLALWTGFKIDYRHYKKLAIPILLLSFLFLFIVFIPGLGVSSGGASRWISLYLITFQPSEFTKLAFILFIAYYLTKSENIINDLQRGLLPILSILFLNVLLIVQQPDLGTSLVIIGTTFIILFVAGIKMLYMLILGSLGATAVIILSFAQPYRLNRLLAFIDPWKHSQDIGFHIVQSLIAIGSGWIWGLGLGASRQKFFYLPQQFTDFIFAILCEEMGFIGGVVVVLLFAWFIIEGLKISRRVDEPFGSLICIGIISWISLQALLNLGVVVGLLPTTGIPLPFISYGGTSLIIMLFSIGIVLNISTFQKTKKG